MTESDTKIIELVARHLAVEADINATPGDADCDALDTLGSIEQEVAALVPSTAIAAIEQLELLSDHDDAGIRALGVLRGLLTPAAS